MAAPLDLGDVQGDILLGGFPKKTELFYFFEINKNCVQDFRKQLCAAIPLITTTPQVVNDRDSIAQYKHGMRHQNGYQEPLNSGFLKISQANIAFSYKGLQKLNSVEPYFDTDIKDDAFKSGMLNDAAFLGDDPSTWKQEFKQEIDGLILVTGDCRTTIGEKLAEITRVFKAGEKRASIHQVLLLGGDVRPGKEKGHEHFGFMDGISQPAVKGVGGKPNNGQETVPQGIILCGREGDLGPVPHPLDQPPPGFTRPSWTLDGSFLCFRHLSQRVPEFDQFLKDHALHTDPSTYVSGSELLGARLVGRWKSGAPIDVTPTHDDVNLANDTTGSSVRPSGNDDFRFDPKSQERCPFAAHIRKTNPRSDLPPGATTNRRMIRRGIQFGPEVSDYEHHMHRTAGNVDRGLFFVSYQSSIINSFRFVQTSWANAVNFPPGKKLPPGFDPIIGQVQGQPMSINGTDPNNPGAPDLGLPPAMFQWVVSRGGEYFFSPSIPALKACLSIPY